MDKPGAKMESSPEKERLLLSRAALPAKCRSLCIAARSVLIFLSAVEESGLLFTLYHFSLALCKMLPRGRSIFFEQRLFFTRAFL